MKTENTKVTIFECSRGMSRLVPVRLKAEPRLFEEFKSAIEKNSKKNGHNIHDLFQNFMEGYVNESKSSS